MKIREGVGTEGGSWFDENIHMKIGNGVKTFFWSDCSVGAIPLREKFRRLFDLSVFKDLTVVEMYSLGWGEGGDAWGWRLCLLAWEEDLVMECRSLLSNVTLQDFLTDASQWRPNVVDSYTMHGVYQLLMR